MNKTYQTIWNESLGAWVATSEVASSPGKKSSNKKALAVAITVALSGMGGNALAQTVLIPTTDTATMTSVYLGTAAGQVAVGGINTSAGAIGTGNLGVGAYAGTAVVGADNSSIGKSAGINVTGRSNTSMGLDSGTNVTGNSNTATGVYAGIAVTGDSNTASGNNAGVAIAGNNNNAFGVNAGNQVRGSGNFASGEYAGLYTNGNNNVALGTKAGRGTYNSTTTASDTVSIGSDASARQNNAIAVGNSAVASGELAISIGKDNTVSGYNSGALGSPNTVAGNASYAVGNNNNIAQNNSFVVGSGVTTSQANSVVLGNASADRAATAQTSVTLNGVTTVFTGVGSAANGVVSVGSAGKERQIINVASGQISAASTDAVNGSQLSATNIAVNTLGTVVTQLGTTTAAGLGGTSSYDPITGTVVTALTLPTTGAASYTSTQGALNALATGGARQKYFNANSTAADSVASGPDSVAIGPLAVANGQQAISIGKSNAVAGNNAGALGSADTVAGNASYAVGNSNTIAQNNTFVVGNAVTTSQANSVVLGNASTDRAATAQTSVTINGVATPFAGVGSAANGVVSIGSVGGERQLINVASGQISATSTDAVNGSQLNATNQAITTLQTSAPVQYSNAAGTATPLVPSNSVTLVGAAAGPVTLNNVAAGALNATSTQAVNGSQLFAVTSGVTTAVSTLTTLGMNYDGNSGGPVHRDLGQTLTITGAPTTAGSFSGANIQTVTNPTTGAISLQIADAPKFGNVVINNGGTGVITGLTAGAVNTTSTDAVNGSQLNTTNTNVAAVSTTVNGLGVSTATNLGGGATYNPTTGVVSAPTYNVYGNTTNTVGAAVAALQTAAPVQFANAAGVATPLIPSNSVILVGAAAGPVTLNNVAAGTVAAGSTQAVNGSQLAAVAGGVTTAVADLTALGMNYGGNSGGVVHRNLGETLTITGTPTTAGSFSGGNIKTVTNPTTGAISLQIADAPRFGNVVINSGNTGVITGLTAGAVNSTSTDAINGSQLNTTNTAVTAVSTSLTQLGSTVTQLGATTAAGLGGGATYNTTTGAVSAPTYNVYGSNVTNVGAAVAALQTAAPLQYANAAGAATPQTPSNSVTLVGSTAGSPVTLNNVAAGTVAAGSTQAVNGSQLAAVASGVTTAANNLTAAGLNFSGNTGTAVHRDLGQTLAISGAATTTGTYSGANLRTVTDPATGAINLQIADAPRFGNVVINSGNTGVITGLAAGAVNASSTDAVTGAQLFATNQLIQSGVVPIKYFTANSTLANSVATGANAVAIGPLAVASTANAIAMGNGAAASANAGDVALGAGSSTAAVVNTTGTTINGTNYGFAGTNATSTVSVGGTGTVRTITNVAAGQLSAGSTNAVNGSQLFATNAAVTAVGASVAAVSGSVASLGNATAANLGGGAAYNPATGAVSAPTYTVYGANVGNVGAAVTALQTTSPVQYSNADGGATPTVKSNDITLVGATPAPVVLHNLAAGTAPTDAVNVGQLNTIATNAVAQANQYTDGQTVKLANELAANKRELSAGVAGSMAMASMPQAYLPGKSMFAVGVGAYGGQAGLAVGMSRLSDNGKWVLKLNGSADSRGKVGVGAGAGFHW